MAKFVNFNNNPKGKKTGDCVIRALAGASGKEYYTVSDELYELSKKTGHTMLSKQTYEKWLKLNGFIKHPQPRKPDGTKYSVREIKGLVGEGNDAVVSMATHLSWYDHEGSIKDTWDCRGKTIGNYYTKEVIEHGEV